MVMESINLPDLHHDPLHYQPTDPVETATSLSSYEFVGSSQYSWTPNITSNAGNLNQNHQESGPRSRVPTQDNYVLVPSLSSSMIQHLAYQWGSGESCPSSSQPHHDMVLQYSKIKEEISDTFPAKFTEMINSPSMSMEHYRATAARASRIENEHKDLNAVSEKLLVKTLSSGADFYSGSYGMGVGIASRGSFSQIYPSINISNQSSTAVVSSSLGINIQSLDPLSSARFNGELMGQRPQDDYLGLGRCENSLSFRIGHMLQRQPSGKSCNSINPSHFINGKAETKNISTLTESKAFQSQVASKKSRMESRASCPPFKVRKEKLGDRIAALQQLVAPFGKTDTASVLMEAIGYIKFLQNQVQTLSVPYMRSSLNQTTRVMQGGSGIENSKEDLRGRGLCLVPLSCMSYIITDDGASGVWKHPDFARAT